MPDVPRRASAAVLALCWTLFAPAPLRAGPESPGSPPPWEPSIYAYQYLLPDDDDYLLPMGYADRGALHLEARYNYEDLRTGSFFVGRTFRPQRGESWEITPMLGAVVGRTRGIAPGLEFELNGGPVVWTGEAEVVIDLGTNDDFFYLWSEISAWRREQWRIGLAVQRTRASGAREVEPGAVAGMVFGGLEAGVYAFDVFGEDRFFVLSLGRTW